uniref:Pentraxin family member n=1 Tax=Scophthalmus maximus TaxID=52904 RepID=A0A8D3DHQ0_SCOMX
MLCQMVSTFAVLTLTHVLSLSTLSRCVEIQHTSNSYVEMVPVKPRTLRAFTLCMRVASKLKGEREVNLFAYRTRDSDELKVRRELDGRYSTELGVPVLFEVPQLGALETHLCITCDSKSGAATLFMDGSKSMTKIYKKGHALHSGGRVVIRQDPDSNLGKFDAKQSFVGEMHDVNMWDSVLSASTIRDMYSGDRGPRGNVFRLIHLSIQNSSHFWTGFALCYADNDDDILSFFKELKPKFPSKCLFQ